MRRFFLYAETPIKIMIMMKYSKDDEERNRIQAWRRKETELHPGLVGALLKKVNTQRAINYNYRRD